ncbi:hypothetical protein H206_06310 [Candidatus Electrothrix aarhusensis]|uniref:Uncharacterized protein n=1 Tax=Candidatus Electrothrix aarhusensis TaxID=1859131 RepID=A0A3S3QHE7_9BACT|nr:hypothetical protein H206_06310 [Candidatus Electrothrix aarhusensis]
MPSSGSTAFLFSGFSPYVAPTFGVIGEDLQKAS